LAKSWVNDSLPIRESIVSWAATGDTAIRKTARNGVEFFIIHDLSFADQRRVVPAALLDLPVRLPSIHPRTACY